MAFKAERISRQSTITLSAPVETVFRLFGAIEEEKWAPGWRPTVVFSDSGTIQDQMVFTTKGHQDLEPDYTWTVSRYEPENWLVEYTVFTLDRLWRISIRCRSLVDKRHTDADVCYTYTGLNEKGNTLNKQAIASMFAHDLKDWERQINYYLETGQKQAHV
jgi:hypothetical protein